GNADNPSTKHAVGGGLPVEIWSRFMRTALSGHAPAPLPGLGDNGWFSFPVAAAAPSPPADVSSQPPDRSSDSGGLDFLLLGKLFGPGWAGKLGVVLINLWSADGQCPL